MKLKKISSRKDIQIVIDAGHGGKDSGAVRERSRIGLGKVLEEDIVLEIANLVCWFCARHNISYLMTRWGDRYVSLRDRCRIANQTRAKLFLSIHCNSHRRSGAKGIEAWYFHKSRSGKLLAQKCLHSLGHLGYSVNRGAKAGRFYVLRHTKMKAVLVELGFISNLSDVEYLRDHDKQQMIAYQIYDFIREACL